MFKNRLTDGPVQLNYRSNIGLPEGSTFSKMFEAKITEINEILEINVLQNLAPMPFKNAVLEMCCHGQCAIAVFLGIIVLKT